VNFVQFSCTDILQTLNSTRLEVMREIRNFYLELLSMTPSALH